MSEVLYHLCRHCVDIMDGWIPYPSTILCKVCNLSLYKTRKELKALKEQGYVIADRYTERNRLLGVFRLPRIQMQGDYKTAPIMVLR